MDQPIVTLCLQRRGERRERVARGVEIRPPSAPRAAPLDEPPRDRDERTDRADDEEHRLVEDECQQTGPGDAGERGHQPGRRRDAGAGEVRDRDRGGMPRRDRPRRPPHHGGARRTVVARVGRIGRIGCGGRVGRVVAAESQPARADLEVERLSIVEPGPTTVGDECRPGSHDERCATGELGQLHAGVRTELELGVERGERGIAPVQRGTAVPADQVPPGREHDGPPSGRTGDPGGLPRRRHAPDEGRRWAAEEVVVRPDRST